MGILDIEIVKGFMRMCNDGWLQGWHERNGGNLTYRMKEEEVAQCRPFFDEQPRGWVNMGVQADNLAGEYFITTGSGKFFRNVEPDPVHSIYCGDQRQGRQLAHRLGLGGRRKAHQ